MVNPNKYQPSDGEQNINDKSEWASLEGYGPTQDQKFNDKIKDILTAKAEQQEQTVQLEQGGQYPHALTGFESLLSYERISDRNIDEMRDRFNKELQEGRSAYEVLRSIFELTDAANPMILRNPAFQRVLEGEADYFPDTEGASLKMEAPEDGIQASIFGKGFSHIYIVCNNKSFYISVTDRRGEKEWTSSFTPEESGIREAFKKVSGNPSSRIKKIEGYRYYNNNGLLRRQAARAFDHENEELSRAEMTMKAYGAEVILTQGDQTMVGYIPSEKMVGPDREFNMEDVEWKPQEEK